jgi:hypothetical protein
VGTKEVLEGNHPSLWIWLSSGSSILFLFFSYLLFPIVVQE